MMEHMTSDVNGAHAREEIPGGGSSSDEPIVWPEAEMVDTFTMWMSLALDGLLSDDERRQFEACLVQHPELADEWADWQELDQVFTAAPPVEPQSGFVRQFEVRLARKERRRRLWMGSLIGVAVVLLWGSFAIGAVSLSAFVMFAQPDWLSQLVHNIAYVSVTVTNWFASAGSALDSVLATPQARNFAIGYAALVATVLILWTQFLHRSTRLVDAPVTT
ncbi:MAG: hypothetical protein HC802_00410 [Caldilineaceae bacterium]|nr:hypothetical protein [Caldilineaceae bacterium]